MCWVCQNKPTNRLYKATMSTKKLNLIFELMLGLKAYKYNACFTFHALNILC